MEYNINEIIRYCERCGINISPQNRENWAMFCNALKVLGYDENTFVALSNSNAAAVARKVWQNERNPHRYRTPDTAAGMIVNLAKEAGVDVRQFAESKSSQWCRPPSRTFTALPRLPKITENSVTAVEYVAPELVEASARQVEASALFDYLCSQFPADEVRQVCADYRVGATKAFAEFWPGKMASAFPLINIAGQIVDVHLMAYADDGHRRKCADMWKCQNWLLAKLHKKESRAPWCLFGEHLAALRPSAPIGIVESEKTALIASIASPAFVWCATLSLANLNARRLAAVKERDIYLFPDRDGVEQWEQKAVELRAAGFRIAVCSQYIIEHASNEKDDLADIIIKSYDRSQ